MTASVGDLTEGASDATGYKDVSVVLGRSLTENETVTVPLTVAGATVSADYAFMLEPPTQTGVTLLTSGAHSAQEPAIHFTSGGKTAMLRFTPVNNGQRTQPYIVIRSGQGAQAPKHTNVAEGIGALTGGPVRFLIQDDETGPFTVPSDWPLKPAGLNRGQFRLVFLSSGTRQGIADDLAYYQDYLRELAAAGHASYVPYAGATLLLGCTKTFNLREHTGITDSLGVPIFWLNGKRVADTYHEFLSAPWKAQKLDDPTNERGVKDPAMSMAVTGCLSGGTTMIDDRGDGPLGTNYPLAGVFGLAAGNPIGSTTSAAAESPLRTMAVTPVFTIDPTGGTLTSSDGDADGNVVEGASGPTGYKTITITVDRTITGNETVTVPLTVMGATVYDDYTFDLEPATQQGVALLTGAPHSAQNPAVEIAAGTTVATLRFTPANNYVRTQPYIVISVGTSDRLPAGSGATPVISGGPFEFTILDDETGEILVPFVWPLAGPSLNTDFQFRKFFITSAGSNATSTDIADYDAFVQRSAATAGHRALVPFAGFFKAFASTKDVSDPLDTGVHAREHNGMWDGSSWTDASNGVNINWLGNGQRGGSRIANSYSDFCDGSWSNRWSEDNNHLQHADLLPVTNRLHVWSGTGKNCAAIDEALGSGGPLGSERPIIAPGTQPATEDGPLHSGSAGRDLYYPLFAMSPVFTLSLLEAYFAGYDDDPVSVAEGDTLQVRVSMRYSASQEFTIPVRMRTRDKLTASPMDFTLSNNGNVTIARGQSAGYLTLTAIDDKLIEGTETLTLEFGLLPEGMVLGAVKKLNVAITDNDDPPPVISFGSATYSAGEESGNRTVNVVVNAIPTKQSGTTAVAYTTGGTAEKGVDFTVAGSPVQVDATGTANIAITVADDMIDEDDETIILTLTGGTDYRLDAAASTTTVTITDDDTAGVTVTESGAPPSTFVSENPAFVWDKYTIALNSQPLSDVVIRISVDGRVQVDGPDAGATFGSVEELTFTPSNWGSALTVTVRGQDDDIENSRSELMANITHSVATGDSSGKYTTDMAIGSISVLITDEEAAPIFIGLSVSPDSVAEDGGPTVITVKARVNGATVFEEAKTVTVWVVTSAVGGNRVDFRPVSSFDITINAGERYGTGTFILTPVDDNVDELDASVLVMGDINDDDETGFRSAIIKLTDDDAPPPGITLSVNPASATENGGSQTISVTAMVDGTTRFGEAKTVSVSVGGHNAAGQVQFAEVSSFDIIIAAGAASGTGSFALTPVDNDTSEASGEAVITGVLDGVTVTGVSVAVTDDDDAPAS